MSDKWWRTAQQIRDFYAARKAAMNTVPSSQHAADKQSARFKMIGGPYHGQMLRVYAPFDAVVFPSGDTYSLCPPAKKDGKWAYAHDPELSARNSEQNEVT
jgi:hypothetical protein